MNIKIIRWATIAGLLAVALGAFGAHGLKALVEPERVAIFETGVRYQFFHTFALLALGALGSDLSPRMIQFSARSFMAGITLFSGSLYLLAIRDILPFPVGWAGPITPIGGLFFIIGWGCFFGATFYSTDKSS